MNIKNLDIPKPDNIEISVVDYCNRKCHFCPHSYGFEGKGMKITLDDIRIIGANAQTFLEGKKLIVLSGKGEPLLHPEIIEIIKILKSYDLNIKIITNGDFLENKYGEICSLLDFNTSDYLDIDNYDGLDQYLERKEIYKGRNITFITHDLEENSIQINNQKFSCTKTNRAGSRNPILTNYPCFKLFSQLYILSNGSIGLCCEDWKYQLAFFHVSNISFEKFWYLKIQKIRLNLAIGKRGVLLPCSECDCKDSAPGFKNFKVWKKRS